MTRDNHVTEISSGAGIYKESVVLTIDEPGAIARVGVNFAGFVGGDNGDDARADGHRTWMDNNYPECRDELRQDWATDPIERSAIDIGRESLAAAREFDVQYEG